MKTASVSQTKNQLSALLDQVKQGETVVITDHDRPVAKLTAMETPEAGTEIGLLERSGLVRRGSGKPCDLPQPLRAKASALEALLDERAQGR